MLGLGGAWILTGGAEVKVKSKPPRKVSDKSGKISIHYQVIFMYSKFC